MRTLHLDLNLPPRTKGVIGSMVPMITERPVDRARSADVGPMRLPMTRSPLLLHGGGVVLSAREA